MFCCCFYLFCFFDLYSAANDPQTGKDVLCVIVDFSLEKFQHFCIQFQHYNIEYYSITILAFQVSPISRGPVPRLASSRHVNKVSIYLSIYLSPNWTENNPAVKRGMAWSLVSWIFYFIFSAECTIGLVRGLTALKHYGNKALWE